MADGNIGSRLREALSANSIKIRAFQREIQPKLSRLNIRGGSYPTIHKYLKGRAAPSRPFLEVAAAHLNVRLEWLLHGTGGMSNQEFDATPRDKRHALRRAVMAAHYEFANVPPAVRDHFLSVLVKYALTAPDWATLRDTEEGHGTLMDLAGDLLTILRLPLHKHPVRGTWNMGNIPQEQLEAYYHSALTALQLVLTPRGKGEPTVRYPRTLLPFVRRATTKRVSPTKAEREMSGGINWRISHSD